MQCDSFMSEDHKYTKEGKKELNDSLKEVAEHNSNIIHSSDELTNNLNKEGNYYEEYSNKIYGLYQNLTNKYEEFENTISERLYVILLAYAIFVIVYRFSLYTILVDYWYEPVVYIILLISSVYLIEVRVMKNMRQWKVNKLNEIKFQINQVDDNGKRKIQLLKNDENMRNLTNEVNQIVGIASLFSEKILQ